MKKKLLFIPAIGLLYVSLSSYSTGPSGTPSGAQTAKTGCGGCHGGQASNANMAITVLDAMTNQPVTDGKYNPGGNYNISFSQAGTSASKFGYIALITDAANAQAGTLANPQSTPGIKITNKGSFQVAEQPFPQDAVSGGISASFNWTAPAAGKGDVTIYVAINGCNGNGGADAGDTWALKNLTLSESWPATINEISEQNPVKIYPNPAADILNIVSGENDEPLHYSIANLNGAVVLSGTIENKSSINVSSLPQGVHIIKLQGTTINEVSTFTKL